MTPGSKKAALSVGVVVLLIGAFFLGRITVPEARTHEMAKPPAGVDQTELRSERGAVLAATAFATAVAQISAGDEQYIQQIEEMAAPEWLSKAADLAHNALEFVQDRYGTGGTLSFSPVQFRVVSFSSSEATIDIWGVVLASGQLVQGIEESWSTSTINLVWASDRWLISDQKSKAGPTPQLVQEGEVLLPDRLTGFEDYASVPKP